MKKIKYQMLILMTAVLIACLSGCANGRNENGADATSGGGTSTTETTGSLENGGTAGETRTGAGETARDAGPDDGGADGDSSGAGTTGSTEGETGVIDGLIRDAEDGVDDLFDGDTGRENDREMNPETNRQAE
ncbi:MAG: hypothetical protein Q4F29_04175 [Lachnospiraceae bacterium]|nr:hypothetical protein [Lachnospiraceae bacterium]